MLYTLLRRLFPSFDRYRVYLDYVIKHKRYVYEAGRRIRVPICQLLIHDWSKFLPKEFIAYARYFYNPDGSFRKEQTPESLLAFNEAWNLHIHRNPHHWQYWVLTYDSGKVVFLEMPEKYLLEMVADWMGAGRAQGRNDLRNWFDTREALLLHPNTLMYVRDLVYALDDGTGVKDWMPETTDANK